MTNPSIVITGLSLRLPGATNLDDFWKLLTDGTDRTRKVSQQRRELTQSPHWNDTIGEIDDIDLFDADFFGIDEDEAKFLDPQQRIVMELAYDAMCDAGMLEATNSEQRRYSVFMAMCTNSYYPVVCNYMDKHGTDGLPPRTVMNVINSALAARVSHQYNLTGPVMAVDTACSSFLTALVQAADSIRHQECLGAVVGGVNMLSNSYSTTLCNGGGITTSNPFTRVFDEEADGTLIGEGAVVCVLEREDIARKHNRRIYGRIQGYAINNDGSSLNIMAPNPRGQGDVIRDCYSEEIDHTRIGYIETHGTGTRIGDPIEVNALSKVYKKDDFPDTKIGIGSVKTNIGHLLAAAGGAGLSKLLLSLRHGEMAPSLNVKTLNPLLQLENSAFDVVTERRPWPRKNDQPRVGALTSLGLGGTNVHFVIEEGETENTGHELPVPLICLSAKTEKALLRMIDDVSRELATGECDPYNLAMTVSRFRPAYDWRATAALNTTSGKFSHVRVNSEERAVKRVLLRPTTTTLAREERLRTILANKIRISDAEPRKAELAITLDSVADDSSALHIDPQLTDIEIAAELFMNGCLVNWEHFFPNGKGTVLTGAAYPFEKKPHWLTM